MSTLVYATIPAFLFSIGVEIFVLRRRPELRGYTSLDTVASLTMGLGNVILAVLTKGVVLAVYSGAYSVRLFDLGMSPWAWAAMIVADDFAYYWFHRLHHEVRLLWAAHVNHHSSTAYNLSTALRQSWTTPFTSPAFWIPLALLGFAPAMILTAQGISLLYQFWIHTEAIGRLGPLESVMNTPSHHRVHHGRNAEYLDRNYGGILIVWDRLFGTFEPERAPVDFGITKNIETYNPLRIAFHEWVAMGRDALHAKGLGEAVAYCLRRPGWSPDGSTHTAPELRAQALAERA